MSFLRSFGHPRTPVQKSAPLGSGPVAFGDQMDPKGRCNDEGLCTREVRWPIAGAECWGWRWGSVPRRGLRGNGPALAGNVGAGWAFALTREGDQGVDVPKLAPARSRCRWVAWEPVPRWSGLIVAIEEKQSSLNRCVAVMALGRGGVGALGRWGVRSAPTGHCMCEYETETTNR